jgi:hypothetical protein
MEALNSLNDFMPYVKIAGVLIGLLLAIITIAALTYVLKSGFGPFLVVLQWTVGHTAGEQPGEVVQGISYGARMLFWAGIIGLVGWAIFHRG